MLDAITVMELERLMIGGTGFSDDITSDVLFARGGR